MKSFFRGFRPMLCRFASQLNSTPFVSSARARRVKAQKKYIHERSKTSLLWIAPSFRLPASRLLTVAAVLGREQNMSTEGRCPPPTPRWCDINWDNVAFSGFRFENSPPSHVHGSWDQPSMDGIRHHTAQTPHQQAGRTPACDQFYVFFVSTNG